MPFPYPKLLMTEDTAVPFPYAQTIDDGGLRDNRLNKTERGGFEPPKGDNTLNRLAICRFRPLSHLSR